MMLRSLGCLILLAATATAAPRLASVALDTHSVIDPSAKVAYVMTDDGARGGKLVAVDLPGGKPRWTSKVAVKPIGMRDGKLVALDGGGRVRVLDARTGAAAKGCNLIPGVVAPFTDGLGVSQAATGHDDGTALRLIATRDTFYSGGAAPSPEMEAAARSHTETDVVLDLVACKATPATKKPPARTIGPIAATTDLPTASGKVAKLRRGKQPADITLIPGNGGAPIDLTEGDQRRYEVSVSIDQRHVMCGDPTNATLAVFDLDTGAISHPTLRAYTYWWMLIGTTMITGGGAVFGYDTSNGKLKWSVAERSTRYDGPYPP